MFVRNGVHHKIYYKRRSGTLCDLVHFQCYHHFLACVLLHNIPDQVHHAILGRIALNMVIAGGVAGIVATLVALFAQLRHRSRYINTNEIANGILGSLVAITGCCPYIAAEQVQEG